MAASKHRGGIPTYRWHPSKWWHLNLWGHMDTPLVWQSKLSLCCLCTGACRCMGSCGHLLCLTKYPFFCVVYVQGASKHHPNIWGHPHILVFPLKLTHTCQDWFPPFAQKKLHSFILTQLDDGSHLEFCHVGFRHCHLVFRHLIIFSQIHSKTLSLHSDSDSN